MTVDVLNACCSESCAAAAERADRWPTLGSHVARLRLEPGMGFNVAETGARVHRTVWGRPLQLLACVTDIVLVGA